MNLAQQLKALVILVFIFWIMSPSTFHLLGSFKLSFDSLIVEVIASGIGVFGAMWLDRRVRKKNERVEVADVLEAVAEEMHENENAAEEISKRVEEFPTLVGKEIFRKPADVVGARQHELNLLKDLSEQLRENIYVSGSIVLTRMPNRTLLFKIMNIYKMMDDLKLVVKIDARDEPFKLHADHHKIKMVNAQDKVLEDLRKRFGDLSKDLGLLSEEIRKEVAVLKSS